jgi:DNA-binding MarR family transcriptional regulator
MANPTHNPRNSPAILQPSNGAAGSGKTTRTRLDKKTLEGCLDCACLSFRQASRMVTQLFDEALVPVGLLSTQLPVLIVINLHNPITITRLASMLIMDRTTLTKNLKPLLTKGYIRTVHSEDKRKTLLELTPHGEALLVKSYPLWRRAQKQIVEGLGSDQWDIVRDKLGQVVRIASGR